MMKKIILFLILVQVTVFAQDEKSQSVELPEFVITGTEKVTLPVLPKKRPKLISTLSEEFFLPAYYGEQVSLLNFKNPLKIQLSDKKDKSRYDGKLILKSGRYTLPYGKFLMDKNFKNLLLHMSLFGLNEKEYVNNAGYNLSGADAGLTLFLSKNSKFLPGLKISADIDAYRDSYKLYGSALSGFLRETNGGTAKIAFEYKLPSDINFNFGVDAGVLNAVEGDLTQKTYHFNFGAEYNFTSAGVEFKGDAMRLNSANNYLPSVERDYFNAVALIKMKFFRTFTAKFGTVFSMQDTNTFISPSASFQLEIDKNIFMFAEFSPYTEFLTIKNYLPKNRFIDLTNTTYNYVEHSSFVKIAFKYEHNKLFETAVGLYLETIKDAPYFEDNIKKGIFNIYTVPEAKRNSIFVDLLFHPNIWGSFYSRLTFNDVRNPAGNIIPYNPVLEFTGSYSYPFNFGLTGGFTLYYYSNIYTDLLNKNKLDDYINLSLNFKYKLNSKFKVLLDFDNVLNKDNYLFKGYIEKPFDISAGVEYRW